MHRKVKLRTGSLECPQPAWCWLCPGADQLSEMMQTSGYLWLEASLANHPCVCTESVTHSTEPLGAAGTPTLCSSHCKTSSRAAHCNGVDRRKQARQIHTCSPRTPTEYGEMELLAQVGVAGPMDRIVPRRKDPNAEGLVCTKQRGSFLMPLLLLITLILIESFDLERTFQVIKSDH